MNTLAQLENSETGLGKTPGSPRNRILIIDDNAAVRAAIVGVLQGAGYQVFQAGDGKDALAKFDARSLDLLLLDLGLPGQDGWDTFEAFTRNNPLLEVIIITGRARQAEIAVAAGVGALMEKPLDAVVLLKTIRDLLTEPEEARLRRLCGAPKDDRFATRLIRIGEPPIKLNPARR
jgi:DNA-binding response OmpR family regulator